MTHYRFEHDSEFGPFFRLWLRNFALTLVTLGIYRFQAKTTERRFLWAHSKIAGDQLEYTGNATEIMVGFMLVFVLVGWPILFFQFYAVLDPTLINYPLENWYNVLLLAVYAVLAPAAIYRSRYYLLSRTRWRGMPFHLSGSAWCYALMSLINLGWLIATFGVYRPWMDAHLARLRVGNIWIGGQNVKCTLQATRLFPSFVLACGGGALAIGGALFWGVVASVFAAFLGDGARLSIAIFLLGAILLACLFFLAQYHATLQRETARHSRWAGMQFDVTLNGWRLTKFYLLNLLIYGVTLGLGGSLVMRRKMLLWAEVFSIDGELTPDILHQKTATPQISGEGLSSALSEPGFEFGF